MKKLQNNFTNTEQSKRLLELGVPEWTADLRYRICKANDSILGNPYLTKGKKYTGSHFNSSLPCWSVGRLMEIFAICFDPDFIEFDVFADGTTFLQQMIDKFERWIDAMDFSKLEE